MIFAKKLALFLINIPAYTLGSSNSFSLDGRRWG